MSEYEGRGLTSSRVVSRRRRAERFDSQRNTRVPPYSLHLAATPFYELDVYGDAERIRLDVVDCRPQHWRHEDGEGKAETSTVLETGSETNDAISDGYRPDLHFSIVDGRV